MEKQQKTDRTDGTDVMEKTVNQQAVPEERGNR